VSTNAPRAHPPLAHAALTPPPVSALPTPPPRSRDVVTRWAERAPDHPALVEAGVSWSYGRLHGAIADAEGWLRGAGVRPGDRVMIVGENSRAFVVALLAIAGVDAWPVVVNARVAARELDEIIAHSGARRVLLTAAVSAQARSHAARLGAVVEDLPGIGAVAVGPLDERVTPEPVDADPGDRIGALLYTSGTTGMPKGVMLTHRNLLFIAAGSAGLRGLGPDDRLYGILPMSHAVGLSVVLLGGLLSGASIYLAPRFDPVAALASLERDRLTIVLGAPAMFALLLEYAAMKGLTSVTAPALRVISSSGAPLHAPVKAGVERLFAMVLHNGYGVTETSPTIAQTRLEMPRTDLSVGPIFPGVTVALIGADGRPVPDGEVGELRVKGPTVMRGYYRAPAETAAAIDADGWFNTRDLARLEDGHLFVVGRSKELIVRFGFNVYPAEVESVLNAFPGVVRSAVLGRAVVGAAGGEEVIAFLQLAPGATVTTESIASHAAAQLAPYKVPSRFVVVASMPLTPTGKVMKDELAKSL